MCKVISLDSRRLRSSVDCLKRPRWRFWDRVGVRGRRWPCSRERRAAQRERWRSGPPSRRGALATLAERLRLAATCLLLPVLLAGCGTLRTYPGPERPDAEVAVLKGYDRYYLVYWDEAHVSSVDGLRPAAPAPWAGSARLLPGRHWVEVTRHSTVGGYSVCVFDTEFLAGHRYALQPHGMHTETPYLAQPYGGFYRGTLSLEVLAPGSPSQVRTVATVCAPRGSTPSFCTQDADCAHLHGTVCRSVLESSFGTCVSRDR